jgi:hypothetical protein
MVVTAVGLASIGGHQGWWNAGLLIKFEMSKAIAITVVGGLGFPTTLTLACLFVRIFRPKHTHLQRNEERKKGSTFARGLVDWIVEGPPQEKASRRIASLKIIRCKSNGSDTLDLSGLGLTSLPKEIGQLTHVKKLYLMHNPLIELPVELSRLTQLETLNVTACDLQFLPDWIGSFANLQTLVASLNPLQTLPASLGRLSHLETVWLVYTSITHIPQVLSTASRTTVALISWPPISADQQDDYHERLRRGAWQGATLFFTFAQLDGEEEEEPRSANELLQELAEIVARPPLTLTQLAEHENIIRDWLARLSRMSDFKTKHVGIANLAYEALEKAEKDEKYRDIFISCLIEATASCGDRVAYFFIYLEIQFKILECVESQDINQLAYFLGHGRWAMDQLADISKAQEEDLKTNGQTFDEIELYLVYPIELKEHLNLGFTLESMLYKRCSGVTEEDLEKAGKEVKKHLSDIKEYSAYLIKQDEWMELLQKHPDYPQLEAAKNRAMASLPDDADEEAWVTIGKGFDQEVEALTMKILENASFPFSKKAV